MILFLTSINYKDCKLQTLTTSRGWSVLFLTSLLMITSGNYFRISEKHLSAVNIEFLLELALKVRDFLTNNKNCCWGTTYCCYFPAFPMLQLLKIVFTFGNELLIALCRGYKPSGLRLAFLQQILCPKNERQQGKRRLLGSKKKYWIENIWKKHDNFLSEQRENNKGKLKKTKNDAGECFFGVPHSKERCKCFFDVSRRNCENNTSTKHNS